MRKDTSKGRLRALEVIILVAAVLLVIPIRGEAMEAPLSQKPKYIFIFLADGAGVNHLEAARLYNRRMHQEDFSIVDRIFSQGTLGLMTTHSVESLTTDSGASATALANGCKANIGVVGICADGSHPLSVMELAKKKGMRLALITNSTVYDASPAAFSAHVPKRALTAEIIDAYLRLEPDLLMGGGRSGFLPSSREGSERKDNRDVIAEFKDKGYAYVSDRRGVEGVQGPKVLGLFGMKDMSFELDRPKDREPSVLDMTREALRLLQQKKDGFVMFVENENIDSAAHLSDVASVIHEFRVFDHSVALAYDFYQRHPTETLVLVTSDHETGGFAFTGAAKALGLRGRENRIFPSTWSLERIRSIRISISKALKILGQHPTANDVDRLMADYYPGFHLPPELKQMLIQNKPLGPTFYSNWRAAALGAMVGHNTQAFWVGRGHTHQPVFVGALGVGAHRFRGYQDNTDFARHLFHILGAADKP